MRIAFAIIVSGCTLSLSAGEWVHPFLDPSDPAGPGIATDDGKPSVTPPRSARPDIPDKPRFFKRLWEKEAAKRAAPPANCTSTAIRTSNPDHPYICRVQAHLGSGHYAWGSGALVQERDGCGYVLTAKHVIRGTDPRTISVHFPSGHWMAAAVQAVSDTDDLVLLRIAATGIRPAVLRGENPAAGEVLYVAGASGGRTRFDAGRAAYLTRDARTGSVQLCVQGAQLTFGDSGGPILDAQGRFCGVLWGGTGGTTWASRWTAVRAILGRVSGISQVSAPAGVPGRDTRAAAGFAPISPSPLFQYQSVQSCPSGNCGAFTNRRFFRR